MRKRLPKILITGGAGFIGSALLRWLVNKPDGLLLGTMPLVVDSLTYAGDLQRLAGVKGSYKFFKTDICNKKQIDLIFSREKPEYVLHFAAESHVDRSIHDATAFIETNIKGTQVLMDTSRKYGVKKFIFISTDEVYGEITQGKFNESSPIKPNSPYAASKAAADHLVQAYIRTYSLPAIIIRPSNNYGPWQYPEKLIPLAILRVLAKEKVPVYGEGLNVREWLYVDDCVEGILKVMQRGRIGQVYNLGSSCESKNIDTVKLLLKTLGASPSRFIFVRDRLGHDLRYSLNSAKANQELGWQPRIKLAQGLRATVDWSLKHQSWLKSKLAAINKLYNK